MGNYDFQTFSTVHRSACDSRNTQTNIQVLLSRLSIVYSLHGLRKGDVMSEQVCAGKYLDNKDDDEKRLHFLTVYFDQPLLAVLSG